MLINDARVRSGLSTYTTAWYGRIKLSIKHINVDIRPENRIIFKIFFFAELGFTFLPIRQ